MTEKRNRIGSMNVMYIHTFVDNRWQESMNKFVPWWRRH